MDQPSYVSHMDVNNTSQYIIVHANNIWFFPWDKNSIYSVESVEIKGH